MSWIPATISRFNFIILNRYWKLSRIMLTFGNRRCSRIQLCPLTLKCVIPKVNRLLLRVILLDKTKVSSWLLLWTSQPIILSQWRYHQLLAWLCWWWFNLCRQLKVTLVDSTVESRSLYLLEEVQSRRHFMRSIWAWIVYVSDAALRLFIVVWWRSLQVGCLFFLGWI